MALLDGPSMFLIALAIAASERGRLFTAAAIVGVAGLGRETNLLRVSVCQSRRDAGGGPSSLAALILAALPLLLWQDYLRSIDRSTSASGHPAAGAADDRLPGGAADTARAVIRGGGMLVAFKLGVVVCLGVQAAYLSIPTLMFTCSYRHALRHLDADRSRRCREEVFGSCHRGVTLPRPLVHRPPDSRNRRQFWPWFVLGNCISSRQPGSTTFDEG